MAESAARRCDLAPGDVHTPSAGGGEKSPKRPAALAIVTDERGRVLTVSRPEPPREMALPGGHVDDGEGPQAAAVRELFEETGVRASAVERVGEFVSPTDGRTVHVFRATAWSGAAYAAEPDTRVEWLSPADLLAQAVLYRPTVRDLMPALVTKPDPRQLSLSIPADERAKIPLSKFAWPEKRKYPLRTAEEVKAAASYLVKEHNAGQVPDDVFPKAKARIARAARRFGIQSSFAESDKAPSAGRGRRAIHIRADLAPGGALHVRHMTTSEDGGQAVLELSDGTRSLRDVRHIRQGDEIDPATAGVTLIGPPAWDDGTPKKLVWIQLAECGAWKGHVAGPFEMTPATFSEVVRNFEARGLPIPFDYEHASELAATEGSVPQSGAPAPGWAHRLDNRGVGGLWGLVEWLDKARKQIKAGEYAFLSPTMRFGCKDSKSGQPIGARLTSVALTNQPFLAGLEGLRAAKDGAGAHVILGGAKGLDRTLKQPHEYMPSIRQALKLHETASPADCSELCDRLRDMCEMADAAGMHQGVDVGAYMRSLADVTGAGPAHTYGDILDTVETMIEAAIDQHVAEYHAGEAPAALGDTDDEEGTTMTDQAHVTALKDAQEKASTLEQKLGEKDGEIRSLSDKVTARDSVITAKDAEIAGLNEKLTARDSVMAGKDGEIKSLTDKLDGANAKLKAHDEAEEKRVVGERFLTHKDVKKMSEEAMLSLFRSDRALFDKEFPHVDPDKRHLLREVTPPAPTRDHSGTGPDAAPVESLHDLTSRLMSEAKVEGKRMTYAEAQERAAAILKARG